MKMLEYLRKPLNTRGVSWKVSWALRRTCRLLSGKKRSLPDFIIIGAQKSGTTSLYSSLSLHPQILRALNKEVHYFDNNYKKGSRWYCAHFPLADELPPGSITGEASPSYMLFPHVAGRIRELVPDVKLIAILRNPVERALSQYFNSLERGWERRPIIEALTAVEVSSTPGEPGRDVQKGPQKGPVKKYKTRGLYKEQLERYLKYFPREQLLVLKSENFFSDPQATLATVFDHLGVDAGFKVPDLRPRNVGRDRKEVGPEVYEYLEDWFSSPNKELYELLGRDFGW